MVAVSGAAASLVDAFPLAEWRTSPWPHLIASPFDPGRIAAARHEVEALPHDAFTWQHTPRIQKGSLSDVALFGPALRCLWDALVGEPFVAQLRARTGLEDLRSDADGTFAGVFVTPPGGWQRVHEDFPRHPASGLWHRGVALVYLSEWTADSGGELDLWDAALIGEPTIVEPIEGRMIVWQPSAATLHGVRKVHPASGARVALAARYYSSSPPAEAPGGPASRTVRRPGERRRDVRPGAGEVVDYLLGRRLASRRSLPARSRGR